MQVALGLPRVVGPGPFFGLRCRCGRGSQGRSQQVEPHTNIPLVGVKATATVTDMACEVTLVQRYRNDEQVPLEVSYTFPIDSGAAVCKFEAEVDGRRVVGTVMPTEEARNTYDDAIAEGHGAYLLEQKKEEIFTMNVGNLPPGKECIIHITYAVELTLEDGLVRFTLPTTIAPRYQGVGTTKEEQDALQAVALALPASGGKAAGGVGRGLELDVAIEMPSSLVSVESPSHPIRLQLNGDAPNKGRVSLSTAETALDRDFVLLIQQRDAHQPGLWIDNERQAVMLNLFPRFADVEQKREFIFVLDRSGSMSGAPIQHAKAALQLFLRSLPEDCKFNVVGFGSRFEFLFRTSQLYNDDSLQEASRRVEAMTADLGGTELLAPLQAILDDHVEPEYARQVFVLTDGEVSNTEAVLQAVRERVACKTDDSAARAVQAGVCTFQGSRDYLHQFWYHCRTCYPRDKLSGCCVVCKDVCHKGHALEARFGGFFCDCGSDSKRQCRARTADASRPPIAVPKMTELRVFTLGIGSSVSRELVLGMARVGRGTAEFVVPGERLESKVMRQLRLAMQPSVDDVTCDWGAAWGAVLVQAPEVLPPLFDGVRLSIYGLVKRGSTLPTDAEEPITVSYTTSSNDAEKQVITLAPAAALAASTPVIRTLAARSRVRELTDSASNGGQREQIKAEIEVLGVMYQIMTAYTSFVAKDERDEATTGTMQRVAIAERMLTASPAFRATSNVFHGFFGGGARGGSRGGRGGSRGGRGGGTFGGSGGTFGGSGSSSSSLSFGYGGGGLAQSKARRSSGSRSDSRDRDRSRSRSPPRMVEAKRKRSRPSRRDDDDDNDEDEFSAQCEMEVEENHHHHHHHHHHQQQQQQQAVQQPQSQHDQLAKLVLLQRANGSFELNDALARLLGASGAALRPPASTGAEAVWATALALAFLELKLSALADEWAMLADKARRWLRRETQRNEAWAKLAWLEQAKQVLRATP